MLTLILFRHAKSSWDQLKLKDFDRPLAVRGKKAALQIAARLARQDLVPELVLCSAARRTRATLELALGKWKKRPTLKYSEDLYMATPKALLSAVRAAPAEVGRLMVIDHNPGLEAFALELVGSGDPRAWSAMAIKFPTAAFAVITFGATSWSAVGSGKGRLVDFVTPRQLASGKA
jgi:phosphohistidine phosphatase